MRGRWVHRQPLPATSRADHEKLGAHRPSQLEVRPGRAAPLQPCSSLHEAGSPSDRIAWSRAIESQDTAMHPAHGLLRWQ